MARPTKRFDAGRRRFLTQAVPASALVIGAPTLLSACGDDRDRESAPSNSAFPGGERVPFHGPHQAGVLQGAPAAGIVVALDRMEKLPSPDGDDAKPMPSAIGEIRKEYGVPIFAILTLNDIINGMAEFASPEHVKPSRSTMGATWPEWCGNV